MKDEKIGFWPNVLVPTLFPLPRCAIVICCTWRDKMNIGEISKATGLPVKTLRYYEEIGLISPSRAPNGYRLYDAKELEQLQFLSQARAMGFPLEECRSLLALLADRSRASRDVHDLAHTRLLEVQKRIADLKALEMRLEEMMARCRDDDNPDCAILDSLSRFGTKITQPDETRRT
ncbi:MerR family transcriptional regulator [Thioclava sp. GXIMD4216]|uniref:MerR family transcriptional regulator n=1 Tax=Thioclava sp. GXIMD4216 TaxID=3131929 RepID=UPI0030D18C21